MDLALQLASLRVYRAYFVRALEDHPPPDVYTSKGGKPVASEDDDVAWRRVDNADRDHRAFIQVPSTVL